MDEWVNALGAQEEQDRSPVGEHTYLCIDLKTFYASVECADRGLDPFTSRLVVADPSRGRSTICLAITPALKELGIRNRCRVFEIPEQILATTIMARPRMRHYMEVSAQIYGTYLEFVSPSDIHPYSIDECFIDATPYLKRYGLSAEAFARRLMDAVEERHHICATAGIGPNLFLAKVALDITAKHVSTHIGVLDEERFRREIWPHRPITDIWGIGPGIAARLAKYRVYDLMGVAALDEVVLYRELGVNAEYLIDHAFGREPTTIAEIQAYRPAETSYVNGQVLPRDYTEREAHLVMREMVDTSVLELVDRGEVTDHISLSVGYARERGDVPGDGVLFAAPATGSLSPSKTSGAKAQGQSRPTTDRARATVVRGASDETAARPAAPTTNEPPQLFTGEHGTRRVGGRSPFGHAGGSRKLGERTDSRKRLLGYFERLWSETVDPTRKIRRINIGFGNLMPQEFATVDLFSDTAADERERRLAEATLAVKDKFGKNALLRGTSLTPASTARERNEQVGGHHA
ncbi:DNA repair protein [Collinsella intestinalis]|uniref:Y-family DNA polymerase n=1 Tax=Collinsella intestinalis TaxID=147207 RepID=UPI0019599C1A|nr:DNA repair protein [Collinsella intestinalis]MBM6683304.1 DNA repair protein [Collinsella intestinalis]